MKTKITVGLYQLLLRHCLRCWWLPLPNTANTPRHATKYGNSFIFYSSFLLLFFVLLLLMLSSSSLPFTESLEKKSLRWNHRRFAVCLFPALCVHEPLFRLIVFFVPAQVEALHREEILFQAVFLRNPSRMPPPSLTSELPSVPFHLFRPIFKLDFLSFCLRFLPFVCFGRKQRKTQDGWEKQRNVHDKLTTHSTHSLSSKRDVRTEENPRARGKNGNQQKNHRNLI